MKINRKGFTLIELMATIVIMGVLSTIGVVSVNRLVDASKKKYCETQKDLVATAAQSYYNDHRGELPTTINKTVTLHLTKMQETNYIGKVVKYNKEEYRDTEDEPYFVKVQKVEKGKYTYTPNIDCETPGHYENPNNATSDNFTVIQKDLSGPYYTNNTQEIEFNVTNNDANKKVYGYKYELYIRDHVSSTQQPELYYRSDAIYIKEPQNSVDITITVNKKTCKDGAYIIVIIPIDEDGKLDDSQNSSSNINSNINMKSVVVDTKKPTCKIKAYQYRNNILGQEIKENIWYESVALKLQTEDKNPNEEAGSFLDDGWISYFQNMNIDYINQAIKVGQIEVAPNDGDVYTRTAYGVVEDKAGNINNCTRTFTVDKRIPQCSYAIYKKKDDKKKYFLTLSGDSSVDFVDEKIESQLKCGFVDGEEFYVKPTCYFNDKRECEITGYKEGNTSHNNLSNNYIKISPDTRYSFNLSYKVGEETVTTNTCTVEKFASTSGYEVPTCNVTINNPKTNGWYNSSVMVTAKCSNNSCNNSILKEITTNTAAGTSIGNLYYDCNQQVECVLPSSINIDSIPPTCHVEVDDNIVKRYCVDNAGGSGCTSLNGVANAQSITVNATGTYGTGYVYDNAGNVGVCAGEYVEKEEEQEEIIIDKTPPKLEVECPNCGDWIKTKDNNGNYVRSVKITVNKDADSNLYIKENDGSYVKKDAYKTEKKYEKTYQASRQLKLCYKVKHRKSKKTKSKCVNVMIDNDKPVVTRGLYKECSNCQGKQGCGHNTANDQGIPNCTPTTLGTYFGGRYNMLYQDVHSGLGETSFSWLGHTSGGNRNGHKYHIGYLNVSTSTGKLTYVICDTLGNCARGSSTWS